MQEPSAVILPDGTIIDKNTDEATLLKIRAEILKNRLASWTDKQYGSDAANCVLFRWSCWKHGSDPSWEFEESGIGPPLQLRAISPTRTSLNDEEGLLCIIDPDAYVGTTDKWEEFERNLSEQASLQRALTFDLGQGGSWDTAITIGRVAQKAFRSETATIISTDGRLTVCGIGALFSYEPEIPHMFMIGLELEVQPGTYICTVMQLRPPDHIHPEYGIWQKARLENEPDVLIQLISQTIDGASGSESIPK